MTTSTLISEALCPATLTTGRVHSHVSATTLTNAVHHEKRGLVGKARLAFELQRANSFLRCARGRTSSHHSLLGRFWLSESIITAIQKSGYDSYHNGPAVLTGHVSCRTSANLLVAPRTRGLSRVRGRRLRNSLLLNAVGSAAPPERDMYEVRLLSGHMSCRTSATCRARYYAYGIMLRA